MSAGHTHPPPRTTNSSSGSSRDSGRVAVIITGVARSFLQTRVRQNIKAALIEPLGDRADVFIVLSHLSPGDVEHREDDTGRLAWTGYRQSLFDTKLGEFWNSSRHQAGAESTSLYAAIADMNPVRNP